jgi:hypothetical protein
MSSGSDPASGILACSLDLIMPEPQSLTPELRATADSIALPARMLDADLSIPKPPPRSFPA